jgi:tRNA A-37 threonylcarbamoyl transferase component Bud32
MSDLAAELIAQRATQWNLLDEHQVQEAWGHFGRRNVPADEFLQYLQRRQYLTNWQADKLTKALRDAANDGGRGDDIIFFCGDYKLLYLAGTGTFSRVYRATTMATGDIVAIKLLRRRFSDQSPQVAQFLREGKIGIQLKHANIVSIVEVSSKGSMHYLVMDFIEGQNLRDLTKRRKKIEPVEATRIMIGIVSGLAYAFERGVTHRDLKMTNVLMSSQGIPKLVDFGLAAISKKSTIEAPDAPNPRTVDYTGLERACGVRRDDERSDLYFAGCIYYNMLTGRAPLAETKDRIQRLSKTRYADVQPILRVDPTIPKGVAAVVTRSMDLSAGLRYQAPGEMLADLQLCLRRLESGTDAADPAASETEGHGQTGEALFAAWEGPKAVQRSLMIVESNGQMQDVLRAGLKKMGYRVMLTRDPDHAIKRFFRNPTAADCVIFSTLELGDAALEAFNQFAEGEDTCNVAAVLLLGEEHAEWAAKARTADRRVILRSPIKMRDFRHALHRLVPAVEKA